ncbi:MAG: phospholipase D family protein [Candidatus Micrarchaeota archaeon]|nr:phospholipase D family protein [Candidatus Micrarchaeota archaeon]
MDAKEKLFKVWSGEKESGALGKMGNSFYREMEEHVSSEIHGIAEDAEALLLKGASIEPRNAEDMLKEKVEPDLKKVNGLYKLRDEKNLEALRLGSLDSDRLTLDERVLYESFIKARERYKEQSLGRIDKVIERGYNRVLRLAACYSSGRSRSEILEPEKIKNCIMELLGFAETSVYLVSPWIWGVDVILERLEDLKKKNLDIRIVCRPALEGDAAHGAMVERLQKAGIPLSLNSVVHAKFLIVDEVEVLFTSANLTKTSLERNIEFGMRTYELKVVDRYIDEFRKMWEQSEKV